MANTLKKFLSQVVPSACLAAVIVGCTSSSDDPPPLIVIAQAHPDVVLRDVFGEPIPVGSSDVYSPRRTCGRCHDIDSIANGYHFQQGRTDTSGKIDERLSKPWSQQVAVLSPGMFGKW